MFLIDYPGVGWALSLVVAVAMAAMAVVGKRQDALLRSEVAALRALLAATPTDGELRSEVERLRSEVDRLRLMVDEVLNLNVVLRSQVSGLQADRHQLELSLERIRGRIGE